MAQASAPRFQWESGFRVQMATRRKALGMTQTDLANRLRARGLPFHQQTIQRVENGERALRLDEAFMIASELESSVEQMVQPLGELLDGVVNVDSLRRASNRALHNLHEDWGEWREELVVLLSVYERHLSSEPSTDESSADGSRFLRWMAAWILKARAADEALSEAVWALVRMNDKRDEIEHLEYILAEFKIDFRGLIDDQDIFKHGPEETHPENLARLRPAELLAYVTGAAESEVVAKAWDDSAESRGTSDG